MASPDTQVNGSVRLKRLAVVVWVAVAYSAVAVLGSMTTTLPGGISPIFPSAGIALAAALVLGRVGLPSVFFGSVVANLIVHGLTSGWHVDELRVPIAACIGTGAAVAAWVGAYLVRRFSNDASPLGSARNILVLVTSGAFGSAAVSATVGLLTLSIAELVPWRAFGYSWLTWFLGDGFGSVIVAPLILAWQGPRPRAQRPWRAVEVVALGSLTLLLSEVVFFQNAPFEYGLMPLLLWAALRFGMRGTSTMAAAIVLLATIGTSLGKGPFVRGTPNDSLLALHSFLAVTLVFAMVMAGVLLERMNAYQALQESQEQLSAVFNCSASSIAITDPITGTIIDANDTLIREAGLSRKQVVGRTGLELDVWPSSEMRSEVFGKLHREKRLRDLDVKMRTVAGMQDCAANAEFVEAGGRRLVLWEFRNVTQSRLAEKERARLSAELLQATKMEAIGRLAGGIAHDFNNLLTVIIGNCELALHDQGLGDEVRQDLGTVHDAAASAANLTRQLLAFSRKQVLRLVPIDLGALVTRTERMLRRVIGEDINLEVKLAEDIWSILADEGQIEQVVMNLAVNSRDAMPTGGRLVIAISNVALDDAYAHEHPEVRPGDYVLLAVTDSGFGMDSATLSRIFEPFFTTKEQMGTGLGLSTVHGIVRQSGGHIRPSSEPGRGTTFHIYLPRQASTCQVAEVATESVPARVRSKTVLVVEDAPAVRLLVTKTLARLGHLTLEASSAEEALRVAAGESGSIDLLVSDVVLPGMSGPELLSQLTANRPGLAVLYMSGYSDHATLHQPVLDSRIDFLEKPFTPDGLSRKVQDVLGRASRRNAG